MRESPGVFLLYRFVKVLAVAMALGGALGVFLPTSLADARRSGLWIAVPGICLAWIMGFLLAHETGTSLLEMWIVFAMVLSFVAVQIVLFCVSREGRRGRVGFALCMATLVGTVALMVFRPTW